MNAMIRFLYYIKIALYRRSTWVVLLTLIFLGFVVSGISLPKENNTLIGVITNGSGYAQSIVGENDLEQVHRNGGTFSFLNYENVSALVNDVKTGQIECGFIIDEDFDKNLARGRGDDSIECIVSPYSIRSEAAKEVLYSRIFNEYSKELMLKAYDSQYPGSIDSNPIIKEKLIESYQKYAGSDRIFNVEYRD